eukprot:GHVN01064207.1.p1 GENE.GHVN01064207.1~~GHVN01064207.1.p1  ORF type:complete len:121 (-),score=4.03 GHVN01064207.1:424-786(-)
MGWPLESTDVDGAYLLASLNELIFITLPPMAMPSGDKQRFCRPVYRLRRALYGLKRAGGDWRTHADEKLRQISFERIKDTESSLYRKGRCILAIYIDDFGTLVQGPTTPYHSHSQCMLNR